MNMRILATLGIAFALAACGTVPIYTVNNAPVTTASGKAAETAKVRQAILDAGAGLGWRMRDASPGVLNATLDLRGHNAVVEIPYSQKTYSIKLKSSANLNESDGQIHKNYNGWVQNLERAINAKISALN